MKKQAMNALQTQILEKRRKMIVDYSNTGYERNKTRVPKATFVLQPGPKQKIKNE